MSTELTFRLATGQDLPAILEMLADDTLGAERENNVFSDKYLEAFEKICNDPNQELTIAEMNGDKVATFQLTFLQYLTYEGGLRAQIEAVRTNSRYRGQELELRYLSMQFVEQKKRVATWYS